ncbi:XdhC family protein, partial [Bacteroidota bacterium]
VVLITVVERNGSSPGIVGFKMAVSENGNMTGSIGGGVMEYNMVELAKKTAKNDIQISFIKKQIHKADAGKDKSGLMCSGDQTHAFISLNQTNTNTIKDIISVLDKGEQGILKLSHNGLFFEFKSNLAEHFKFSSFSDENWEYTEHIGMKPTLYIFGAGHVSLPLSEIFRVLDFKVVVFDDRKDLSTFKNNKFAHQKQIIDFKDITDIVLESNNSYAVIMTVGHKSDEVVLKQLVTKELKYLGMIGSKNKVKTIFDSLKSQGISNEDLEKVDAPIGLSIKSKTTPEIAISIAAKVILVKNSDI